MHKHNKRYVQADLILKGALGEPQTGKFVARLLSGQSLINDAGDIVSDIDGELEPYKSQIHNVWIDIKAWIRFLHEETKDC